MGIAVERRRADLVGTVEEIHRGTLKPRKSTGRQDYQTHPSNRTQGGRNLHGSALQLAGHFGRPGGRRARRHLRRSPRPRRDHHTGSPKRIGWSLASSEDRWRVSSWFARPSHSKPAQHQMDRGTPGATVALARHRRTRSQRSCRYVRESADIQAIFGTLRLH